MSPLVSDGMPMSGQRLPTQQVTTAANGAADVTFTVDVDPTSVILTVVQPTSTAAFAVAQVVSVVGATVKVRTATLATAVLLGGPVATPAAATVNVSVRRL